MHTSLSAAVLAALFALAGCSQSMRSAVAPANPQETIDITTSEGTLLGLDVSPDGQTIAIDLFGQLWQVPVIGGTARALTDAVADTAEDQDPAFSPDGRLLAFKAERGGERGIWLLELATGSITQLARLPDRDATANDPAWSPDGQHIAFARTPPPDSAGARRYVRIAIIDIATRTIRDLLIDNHATSNLRMPVWLPDGQRIVFVQNLRSTWLTGPGGRLWSVPAEGGTATPLISDSLRLLSPAISPDGRRVAFLAQDSAQRLQVWTLDLTISGVAPVRVTDHADVSATRVRWSADGSTLFYSADGKLRRIAASGGAAAEIPFTARLTFDRPARALPPARFAEPGAIVPARGFAGLALAPDAQQYALLALGQLWVARVGEAARAIAKVPHTARYLSWSPDQQELAWSAGRFEHQDIFATNIATGTTRQVTSLPGRELYPAYSPDGRWLAFMHADSITTLRVIPARGDAVSTFAATRDLGEANSNWNGGDGYNALMWSPRSDALLSMLGWEPDSTAVMELIQIDGTRTRATAFPDWPVHARWTEQGLVWTRHDQLWRASYDPRGAFQPRVKAGEAAAKYPAAARDGSVLYVSGGGLRLRSPAGTEQLLGWPLQFTAPLPAPLLIRNVRVVDVARGQTMPPMDVLIESGRIKQIAPAGTLATSGQILDANGRYAVPGLMDLHAHLYFPELLPGFLYYGVTLVRDQGAGDIAHVVAYADAIASGALPGPRVSFGGYQYHSDVTFDSDPDRGIEVEVDSGHIARAVTAAEMFGAHHLKLRGFRRWDINARLIREAHRRGMRVTSHCVLPLPLIAAGIDAKEHVGACGSRGKIGMYSDILQYDDANQLLRAAGVGVVPTIIYFAFAAYIKDNPDLLAADTALAPFAPAKTAFGWMLELTPAARDAHERAAREGRNVTARLDQLGVTLGTGTDIWQFGTAPHMELEELVRAGVTSARALHAATLGAARIVGVDRDLGSLEVGKLADLVLLDADPLTDIRNTRRIWRVIQGGAVVDREAIVRNYGTGAH